MYIIAHSMQILKSKSYHIPISHPPLSLVPFYPVTWTMPSCLYFLTKEVVLSNICNFFDKQWGLYEIAEEPCTTFTTPAAEFPWLLL